MLAGFGQRTLKKKDSQIIDFYSFQSRRYLDISKKKKLENNGTKSLLKGNDINKESSDDLDYD